MEKQKNTPSSTEIFQEALHSKKDKEAHAVAIALYKEVLRIRNKYEFKDDKKIGAALCLFGFIFLHSLAYLPETFQFSIKEASQVLLQIANIIFLFGGVYEAWKFIEAKNKLRPSIKTIREYSRLLGIQDTKLPSIFKVVNKEEARQRVKRTGIPESLRIIKKVTPQPADYLYALTRLSDDDSPDQNLANDSDQQIKDER